MASNATYNVTRSPNNGDNIPLGYFIFPVSLFGMVGNGIVIWILGCRIKRNHFTTYILSLSVADFGVLMTLATASICGLLFRLHRIDCLSALEEWQLPFFFFTFSASEFLLTVISVDRCVCLFFPLWHKCHRPPHLSTTVCVAIWIFTFLISVIVNTLIVTLGYPYLLYYQFVMNSVLCMPTMAISTVAMLIKVCFMSPHHKRGKLLRAIMLALLFFLLFAFPMNASQFLYLYDAHVLLYFNYYAFIGASLNSAINPVIYFLLGRDKKAESWWKINKLFAKLFQEEEEFPREKVESTLETYL